MNQYNCKNCGAPIKHTFNHQCEYCKSIIDFNVPEENVTEVKPEDLVNIKLERIERGYVKHSIILYFSGYKCDMPTIYECKDNIYVSKILEYRNPEKCGICVEIPILDLEKYGSEYIMYKLRNLIIKPDELKKLKIQIIDELNNSRIFIHGINIPYSC